MKISIYSRIRSLCVFPCAAVVVFCFPPIVLPEPDTIKIHTPSKGTKILPATREWIDSVHAKKYGSKGKPIDEMQPFFERIVQETQGFSSRFGVHLHCDIDYDGDCDADDRLEVEKRYGQCVDGPDPLYNPSIDYNFDGCITEADAELLFSPKRVAEITIDIKPGSYPNSINLKSKGCVPVAVLTTAEFDITTVEPRNLIFAGANVVHWAQEDVDGDGDVDLVGHFNVQDLNIKPGDTEATLWAKTHKNKEIWGTDTINLVPKDK